MACCTSPSTQFPHVLIRCADLWGNFASLVTSPSPSRRSFRVVLRRFTRRSGKGKTALEIPSVSSSLPFSLFPVAHHSLHRLSGYILFPTLLLTAHLGGTYSTWMTMNAGFFLRFGAYTVAPALIVCTVYSRVR
jgi:hypothetical protein